MAFVDHVRAGMSREDAVKQAWRDVPDPRHGFLVTSGRSVSRGDGVGDQRREGQGLLLGHSVIARVAHAAGERLSLFCVMRPVVRRVERLDTLRVEQAGDIGQLHTCAPASRSNVTACRCAVRRSWSP